MPSGQAHATCSKNRAVTTEALAPAATLTSRVDANRLVVALGGAWTADTASAAEAGATKLKAESGTPQSVVMDFSKVTRLDTLGARLPMASRRPSPTRA